MQTCVGCTHSSPIRVEIRVRVRVEKSDPTLGETPRVIISVFECSGVRGGAPCHGHGALSPNPHNGTIVMGGLLVRQ